MSRMVVFHVSDGGGGGVGGGGNFFVPWCVHRTPIDRVVLGKLLERLGNPERAGRKGPVRDSILVGAVSYASVVTRNSLPRARRCTAGAPTTQLPNPNSPLASNQPGRGWHERGAVKRCSSRGSEERPCLRRTRTGTLTAGSHRASDARARVLLELAELAGPVEMSCVRCDTITRPAGRRGGKRQQGRRRRQRPGCRQAPFARR